MSDTTSNAATAWGANTVTIARTYRQAPAKAVEIRANLNFYSAFWVFVLGAFAGYLVETLFCLVMNGHCECRSGMVFGVFNPVYGMGALVLYFGSCKIQKDRITQIFIYGTLVSTAIEFICSWVQEMAFGSVSWDYSNMPLNIGGRICLLFSLFWGILAVLWARFLQPLLDRGIAAIPQQIKKPLTCCLLLFLALDALLSIIAVMRWGMRLNGVTASTPCIYVLTAGSPIPSWSGFTPT